MDLWNSIRRHGKLFEIVLILVAGFFLIRNVTGSLAEVTATFSLHATSMGVALFLISAGFLLKLSLWWMALRFFGERGHDFIDIGWTYCFYQVTTYIPGLIWSFLGVARRGEVLDIRKTRSVASMVLHLGLNLVAATLIATAYLGANHVLPGRGLALLFLVGVAGVIAIHPRIFRYPFNWVLRRMDKTTVRHLPSYRENLVLLCATVVMWTVTGIGFAYLVHGATGSSISFFVGIGVFTAAWAAGNGLLFFPGGLGVRESVMAVLLHPVIGVEASILVAVVARLWWMFPEVVFTLGFGGAVLKK